VSDFIKNKKGTLFIIAIVLILGGSIFAHMFNTSFYSTNVDRINFETNRGILSGLLYKPEGASSNNPRPAIVTTHGYLNSAEMQDAPAIELSRRGYVVLALDLYDHGHSINTTEFKPSEAFFSFWTTAMHDAANYMYEQDYVLKDEEGNGILAVAGHSMGGFSSTMAVVQDEKFFAENGYRKIHSALTMGSDYSFTSFVGVTPDVAFESHGPRVVGKVAAHYDDFFFDSQARETGKTVVYKDYIKTEEGQNFLGNPSNPESGEMYTLDNGGKRVLYTPSEIHPWNHFPATTTSHQIDFYTTAFSEYTSPNQANMNLNSDNQIWFYKELSEFIAMLGFFLLFITLVSYLINLPILSNAKTKLNETIQAPKTAGNKFIYWIILIISALFPALLFPALMSKSGTGMTILKYFALIVLAISIIALVVTFMKKGNKKLSSVILGPIGLVITSGFLYWLITNASEIFKTGGFFNEPTTNQIIYWAVTVTAVLTILTILTHYLFKSSGNISLKQYGFVVNWKSILSALITAVISVVIGYIILFIIDAVFKTDFRFWTWAVKTFETRHLMSALKYMPFFFLYFYVTGITVNANTERTKGWKGYLLGCSLIVGGLVIYMILHYGILFITGTALWPAQALSSILLFALIPTLIVATFFNKIFYKMTGNVYTGVFVNTILVTMMTVANTTLYTGLG
jgi:hypothetical protein